MSKESYPTSFRLSVDALEILRRLSEKLGISQVAVIEIAIRKIEKEEVSDGRQ